MNLSIPQDLAQGELSGTLTTHRLLAVGEHKRCGLILCKPHYAEFAGPGAAIGTPIEQGYTAIIAIGMPEIVEVSSYTARQQAYSRRIQWVRWLHKIVSHPDPGQRAEKLLAGFEAFFGNRTLINLSDDVLALLAGVMPHTMTLLRSQHHYEQSLDASNILPCEYLDLTDGVVMTETTRSLQAVAEAVPNSQRLNHLLTYAATSHAVNAGNRSQVTA